MTAPRVVGRIGVALVAGVVGLTGCSSGAGPTGDLTQAEAGLLLAALSAIFLPSPSIPASAALARAPSLEPTTTIIESTNETSIACAQGGTAVVASADSLQITVDLRLNPHQDTTYVSSSSYSGRSSTTTRYLACGARDYQGGTWIFDIDPGLTLTYDHTGESYAVALTGGGTFSSTSIEWDGTWTGTIGWRSGGRSGTCPVSVVIESATSVVGQQVSSSFSQEGELCGVSVSTSTSTS